MPVEGFHNPLLVQQSFNEFCHLPNALLKNFGLNFNRKSDTKWWNIFTKSFSLIGITAHFYCFPMLVKFFFVMLFRDGADLAHVLQLLEGVNYSFFGTLKFFAIVLNYKSWENIYTELEEIYPKTRKEKLAYRVREHFWPRWMSIMLHLSILSVALITISPLLESMAIFAVQLFKVDFSEAKFPYNTLYEIDYGFDCHKPFNYMFTYVSETLHANFIITSTIVGDILLLCFCLQLCMHFDFLARTLENYEPDALHAAKDQEFIANFLKRHQILLEYFTYAIQNISGELNRTFGFVILVLLMATTGNFCCAAVFCLTQGFGTEFLEYVAFLPTIMGQYFMVCYCGQELIEKSQSVADAAYNHPWYNGSQSYKKTILIILMRSQKAAEINAYGFQPICLEAFKMVMGATYRTFAVLKETML